MKTIRALRQFSHYHAGNFDQGETRPVMDEIAEQLIGLELAEDVDAAPAVVTIPEPIPEPEPEPEPVVVEKPRTRGKKEA
ncbi:hypothetical protein V6W80_17145 [Pseudomonas benzopyrenica]|uniref:Uncharacterized protein n=1 Tax=Pseudomonas benzopyrenica TaxID=2993566 RepID=A0ABZ2FN43_9PSED